MDKENKLLGFTSVSLAAFCTRLELRRPCSVGMQYGEGGRSWEMACSQVEKGMV